MHLAKTDEEALNDFIPAHHDAYTKMESIRQQWNPTDITMSTQTAPLDISQYAQTPDPNSSEHLVGSPRRVAEQIDLMKNAGIRNLMLTNRGLMSKNKTASNTNFVFEV
jgi:alkanesulfonate monooxygenase SsuD/methylene tetrahydromethanopterin reductase-like flavin-dependent oxidoreductase (luciferase family)